MAKKVKDFRLPHQSNGCHLGMGKPRLHNNHKSNLQGSCVNPACNLMPKHLSLISQNWSILDWIVAMASSLRKSCVLKQRKKFLIYLVAVLSKSKACQYHRSQLHNYNRQPINLPQRNQPKHYAPCSRRSHRIKMRA